MTVQDIFINIKKSIDNASENGSVVELHVQVIKYADFLSDISGKDFCIEVGINKSYGTEFNKARNIATRLKNTGLDTNLI